MEQREISQMSVIKSNNCNQGGQFSHQVMIPDPDSNSKNAPAVINNLPNKLMWAKHKFTPQYYLNIHVIIKYTIVSGNNNKDG